jgi:hypothetical protein
LLDTASFRGIDEAGGVRSSWSPTMFSSGIDIVDRFKTSSFLPCVCFAKAIFDGSLDIEE